MKPYLWFIMALALPYLAAGQTTAPVMSTKKHKVIFHLTSSDTLAQKALAKQLNNFLIAAPNARLEVVCHNNGISFLQTSATKQYEAIRDLHGRGVDFVACENTLRERKIKREELIAECRTVPAGIVEVVLRQEQGWSYIKAGL